MKRRLHRARCALVLAACLVALFVQRGSAGQTSRPPYMNPALPIARRVEDLVSRMTLEEKVAQMMNKAPAIERLSVPEYEWWNEALHGVARAGVATVFPQAIGLAATCDVKLMREVADVISTEARDKHHEFVRRGERKPYQGLTFWSPNINIFRDPRWGRGQETYGEDPYLTATMGTAFVHGLQGHDPHYLKASACAKHFVVHSGPEAVRDKFDAIVDEKDFRETYLYAFHALVNSGVESVMSAYNRVNSVPNSINKTLLTDILRNEWGFKGHVVTDCGALDDVFQTHKTLPGPVETAAAAIKAGVNLDCSTILQNDVIKAIDQKLITEKEVDQRLFELLRTEFKLGFYDDPNRVPYHTYGADSVHNAAHIALSRKVALQSMVLLKND